jgi:hypothetical protein
MRKTKPNTLTTKSLSTNHPRLALFGGPAFASRAAGFVSEVIWDLLLGWLFRNRRRSFFASIRPKYANGRDMASPVTTSDISGLSFAAQLWSRCPSMTLRICS